jgi:hypothetical protein
MSTTLVIYILLFIYCLSMTLQWLYVKIAKSTGGRWSHIHADATDFFIMICPLINTLACIIGLGFFPPKDPREHNKLNWDKFFDVKKPTHNESKS